MSRLQQLSAIITKPGVKRTQLRGDNIRLRIGSDESAVFDSATNTARAEARPDYCVARAFYDF